MIEAKEFRIGNLLINNNEVFKVISISISDFNNRYLLQLGNDRHNNNGTEVLSYIENSDPIPITEEWLLKFGFEMYYGQMIFKVYRLGLNFITEYDGKYSMQLGTGMNIELEFVHQLQNLYFAITQTELEIK